MLRELFDAVCKLAVNASKPTVVTQEKSVVVGGVEYPNYRCRADEFYTLASFIDAIGEFSQGGLVRVYVSPERIVAELDQERDNKIVMYLAETKVFSAIRAMSAVPKDLGKLIRYLSYDLGLGHGHAVVAALRNVKWQIAESEKNGTHGFGRDIDAQVSGIEKLPDAFSVPVEVYRGIHLGQADIRVMTTVDTKLKNVSIEPLPDEIENAVEEAMHGIARSIESAFEPVEPGSRKAVAFIGSPYETNNQAIVN